jgi:hypothetical protein
LLYSKCHYFKFPTHIIIN